jgi:hypothetical protein
MRTVETTGIVNERGELSVQVPRDIQPGEHRVVVVIDEQPALKAGPPSPTFPVLDLGPWPDDLSLSRDNIYGDDAR